MSNNKTFYIVGIGASAGGFEALDRFFSNVPEHCGISFIICQHHGPKDENLLPELLQRSTKLNVILAENGLTLKPNCIYIAPSGKNISCSKEKVYLSCLPKESSLTLTIDFLFNSLAEDQKEKSIGVVLSGMGSDGSVGLRSIKESGGLVLVQDPNDSKFPSMPRTAIDSIQVDIIDKADLLPEKLFSYLSHLPSIPVSAKNDLKNKSSLEKILIMLISETGNDFSDYKKNTLYRRIERRMGVHKVDKISAYVQFLTKNPGEINILFNELLIGVTKFFRDIAAWNILKEYIKTKLLPGLPDGHTIRLWTPGCSTGEEAYSLAIILKESIREVGFCKNISIQIFATDIDEDAINKARKGIFQSNITANVSEGRLKQFFVKAEDGSYCVNTEIRELIVFAPHNVIKDPPYTRLDIISCRNLLIYLEASLQKKIFSLFHYSLRPGGILMLGSAETTGPYCNLFNTVDSHAKLYSKINIQKPKNLIDFPTSFAYPQKEYTSPVSISEEGDYQTLINKLLLSEFTPSSVLVNDKGDILHITGRTGKYLEPAAGKANMNIFAMTREGLRSEFPVSLRRASRTCKPVIMHNLRVKTNGSYQNIDVIIKKISKPEALKDKLLVVFVDLPTLPEIKQKKTGKNKKPTSGSENTALKRELKRVKEELQHSFEEMQISQEELKSSNEELQSTNEELQSSNEELSTSKEEMQSLNEELQTVNSELQAKIDTLTDSNNDMKNLLESTEIATLFLDMKLNIRKFTNQAKKIFSFIDTDIGRPISDLKTQLLYPDLTGDLEKVLETLIFIEKDITAANARWYKIRIMPYRTYDNHIKGLVVTFMDITKAKLFEQELKKR